jgi:hypothetical protein
LLTFSFGWQFRQTDPKKVACNGESRNSEIPEAGHEAQQHD